MDENIIEENNENLKKSDEDEKVYSVSEMKSIKNKTILFSCTVFSVILCIIVVCLFSYSMGVIKEYPKDSNILKYLSVLKLYEENYVGDIDLEKAIDYSLVGLVAGVEDKYGGYISQENSKVTGEKIKTGNYKGIGIVYDSSTASEGYVEILEVIKDSPAGRAGLIEGDKITKINDDSISEDSILEFAKSVSLGLIDDVTLEINNKKNVYIVLDVVKSTKVEYEIKDNIGYISIFSFVMDSVNEFKDAIDFMLLSDVNKIVFDLRGNSGGDVNAIVGILDYILDECLIVRLENSQGEIKSIYSDSACVLNRKIDFVVLVDENTASASELFTMVLQEQLNAVIIGHKTFGKSTVVTFYTFKDGSMLAMSTGTYYPESGKYIEGIGIEPDIVLSDTDILLSAIELEEKGLLNQN